MQLQNAEVHVDVLGGVATVVVRHIYRNMTKSVFRFLYDIKPPAESHIIRVEARASLWTMHSYVAPKEIHLTPSDDEPTPKFTPGIWPHANDSGCYIVIDAPPNEDEELFITYAYSQELSLSSHPALRSLMLPCHVVCPGTSEGEAGLLPPDSSLLLCIWDADTQPTLRPLALKEMLSSEGRKFSACLGGKARQLLLQFTVKVNIEPSLVMQRYLPLSLPKDAREPLGTPSPQHLAHDDRPVASVITFCPILPDMMLDSPSVVFLLDCTVATTLEMFSEATLRALQWLPPTCTFNIIIMEAKPRTLFQDPQEANESNLSAAIQFLQHLQFVPSTNFFDALALALDGSFEPPEPELCRSSEIPPPPPGPCPPQGMTEIFLFIGSPVPDVEDCTALVASHNQRARLFSAAYGPLADGQAARDLALAANGRYSIPNSSHWGIEELSGSLKEWMDLVNQPCCTAVNIKWEPPFNEVLAPFAPPILFHQQPCTLFTLHDVNPEDLEKIKPSEVICTISAQCSDTTLLVWKCYGTRPVPTAASSLHAIAAGRIMRSQPRENIGLARAVALHYGLQSTWTCLAPKFTNLEVPVPGPENSEEEAMYADVDPAAEEAEEEEDDDAVKPDNPLDTLKDLRDSEDLYELMALPVTATTADVRKQFKRLAMQFHPDKNPGDDEAHAKFQRILRAYEILSDDERRAMYDVYGISRQNVKIVFKERDPNQPPAKPKPKPKPKRAAKPRPKPAPKPPGQFQLLKEKPASPSPERFGTPAESEDGDVERSSASDLDKQKSSTSNTPDASPTSLRAQPVLVLRLPDTPCRASFSLEKAVAGCVGNMTLSIQRICGVCLGTGNTERGWRVTQCTKCLGVGRVARLLMTPDGQVLQEVGVAPCSVCCGDGYVLRTRPECECGVCQGAGFRRFKISISLSIGPGIDDGKCLVLKGFIGSRSPMFMPGDAVIRVHVHPAGPFEQQGEHLHTLMVVSLRTALCGGPVTIPIPGRQEPLLLPIPEHLLSILPDMELYVPYHGVPKFRTPAVRGHLILHCAIRFPTRLPGPVRRQLAVIWPEDEPEHLRSREDPVPLSRESPDTIMKEQQPYGGLQDAPLTAEAAPAPLGPQAPSIAHPSPLPPVDFPDAPQPQDTYFQAARSTATRTPPKFRPSSISSEISPARIAPTTKVTRVHLNGTTQVSTIPSVSGDMR